MSRILSGLLLTSSLLAFVGCGGSSSPATNAPSSTSTPTPEFKGGKDHKKGIPPPPAIKPIDG